MLCGRRSLVPNARPKYVDWKLANWISLLHGRKPGPPIPARPVSPSQLSSRPAVSTGFAGSRVLPMARDVFVGGHPSARV